MEYIVHLLPGYVIKSYSYKHVVLATAIAYGSTQYGTYNLSIDVV